MMRSNGNGNGNGHHENWPEDIRVDSTNPYRSMRSRTPAESADANSDRQLALDEDGPPTEAEDKNRSQRRRKQQIFGALGVLLIALAGLALWMRFGRTKIDYPVKEQRAREAAGGAQTDDPDQTTAQAVRQAKQAIGGNDQSTTVQPGQSPANAVPKASPVTVSPLIIPSPDLAGTVKSQTDASTGKEAGLSTASNSNTGSGTRSRSQRNPESSIYMTEQEAAPAQAASAKGASVRRTENNRANTRDEKRGVVLPSFGSMLPVRTLGALYTLRSGSLVRFELTRDVSGQGWSMRRGTVLVGVNRGSEYNRAYVAAVGFIDPQTNRLVRVTGDVLGGDGGSGLKGKRHQLTGGWSRALGRLGASMINLGGALASGFGRQSVVVADAYGYRLVSPVSNELSGLVTDYTNRRRGTGFVEVPAGASGYVMVTDLPAAIKGIDALGELGPDELAQASDANVSRASLGLSDRELAELLQSGSLDEIRAALPGMTPEMRRVAEAVLQESER